MHDDVHLLTRSQWQLEYPDEVRPEGAICPHRLAVVDALRQRIYVPDRVLADYPDLKSKYPELIPQRRSEWAVGLDTGYRSTNEGTKSTPVPPRTPGMALASSHSLSGSR